MPKDNALGDLVKPLRDLEAISDDLEAALLTEAGADLGVLEDAAIAAANTPATANALADAPIDPRECDGEASLDREEAPLTPKVYTADELVALRRDAEKMARWIVERSKDEHPGAWVECRYCHARGRYDYTCKPECIVNDARRVLDGALPAADTAEAFAEAAANVARVSAELHGLEDVAIAAANAMPAPPGGHGLYITKNLAGLPCLCWLTLGGQWLDARAEYPIAEPERSIGPISLDDLDD
jgi:hypothetical protein